MDFNYIPHRSSNPYELLAVAILYQAYKDITEYYKNGEPVEHEGREAIIWIKKADGTFKLILQVAQHIMRDYGYDEDTIHQMLQNRIKICRDIALGKASKQEEETFNKAWQLMSAN